MDKITEIIPDDFPVWAKDAFDEGQFFRVSVAKVEALEQEVERLKQITKIAYWHAYEYARMNPDYNHILPVWNRWKLAYPELDKQGE